MLKLPLEQEKDSVKHCIGLQACAMTPGLCGDGLNPGFLHARQMSYRDTQLPLNPAPYL